jgi:hypothetical protein
MGTMESFLQIRLPFFVMEAVNAKFVEVLRTCRLFWDKPLFSDDKVLTELQRQIEGTLLIIQEYSYHTNVLRRLRRTILCSNLPPSTSNPNFPFRARWDLLKAKVQFLATQFRLFKELRLGLVCKNSNQRVAQHQGTTLILRDRILTHGRSTAQNPILTIEMEDPHTSNLTWYRHVIQGTVVTNFLPALRHVVS